MTMYWDSVLQEVQKENCPKERILSMDDVRRLRVTPLSTAPRKATKRVLKKYPLGEAYGDVYFTRREAQCMFYFLKGNNIREVAEHLDLSPRTIEFYVKNMKFKCQCRTKSALIRLVMQSDFMQQCTTDTLM